MEPGGSSVWDSDGDSAVFVGEDFQELMQWVLSRYFHTPYFMSTECQKLKKGNNDP